MRSASVYHFTITVRPSRSVMGGLFDMLRYDGAYPSNPMSAERLTGLARICNSEEELRQPQNLIDIEFSSQTPPTVDRWRSFGIGCSNGEKWS